MPVQDIYKFTEEGDDRRIVAGTIISGSISVGDEVVFLPSNKKSVIKSIEGFNVKPRNTAYADEAIGVTLTTQIYIKPGELMVKANEKHPSVSSRFRANIFWVGKAPLIKNKNYKLKIGTMKIGVKLIEISISLMRRSSTLTLSKTRLKDMMWQSAFLKPQNLLHMMLFPKSSRPEGL